MNATNNPDTAQKPDQESERAAFESWITAPPYERSVHRMANNKAWPGQYSDIAVQLAWEAYTAGVEAGRKTERQDCWDEINKWIKHGDLSGNGCDETAQRNGMVLASNLIAKRVSERSGCDHKFIDSKHCLKCGWVPDTRR